MDCKKCFARVATKEEQFIHCNGPCGVIFHAACVGLDKVDLAAVSPPKRNSFWLCDECLAKFVLWRTERKEEKKESIAPTDRTEPKSILQRDVDDLKAKVDSILSVLSASSNCSLDTVMLHSTPTSSRHFDNALREAACGGTSCVADASERSSNTTAGDENFSLLLTNIDSSVSEEDVQMMVSQCLGVCDTECKYVKKLVPRWVDSSTLDYISFKIVLNCKWKTIAMKSSTWPKNIRFREFRRRQCTWKPDTL